MGILWYNLCMNKPIFKNGEFMNIQMIKKEVVITPLNKKRTITIYLPIDYHQSTKHYPVMYMHDGQNLFDDSRRDDQHTWGISRLVNQVGTPQLIVVGIDHGEDDRIQEYAPFKPSDVAIEFLQKGLFKSDFPIEGPCYIEWLVETLKPMIDATYRTSPISADTYLVGSSMGGLISLYGGLKNPQVFGAIGVLSPSIWFCRTAIMNFVKHRHYDGKIFLSVGMAEAGIATSGHYLKDVEDMACILNERGISVQTQYVKNGKHNEQSWQQLVPSLLQYFYKSE